MAQVCGVAAAEHSIDTTGQQCFQFPTTPIQMRASGLPADGQPNRLVAWLSSRRQFHSPIIATFLTVDIEMIEKEKKQKRGTSIDRKLVESWLAEDGERVMRSLQLFAFSVFCLYMTEEEERLWFTSKPIGWRGGMERKKDETAPIWF